MHLSDQQQVQTYNMERMRTLYLGCIYVTASPALQQRVFAPFAFLPPLICLEALEYCLLKRKNLKVCFYSLWVHK